VTCELAPIEDLNEVLAKLRFQQEGQWLDPANPHHRQFVMNAISGHTPRDSDLGERHRANARGEHDTILRGEPGHVAFGDDDEAHLEEHYQYTTQSAYRAAVEKRLPRRGREERGRRDRDGGAHHRAPVQPSRQDQSAPGDHRSGAGGID
jgi:hypothetical protein